MTPSQVYPIRKIDSITQTHKWESLNAITAEIKHGCAVIWQHHGVFLGEIQDGKINWLTEDQPILKEEHIVRIRIFNDQQEYHFWRQNSKLTGRLRIDDNTGKKDTCIETRMILRGVLAEPLKQVIAGDDLCIHTRNYIKYHPVTGQAEYIDSRFVQFDNYK